MAYKYVTENNLENKQNYMYSEYQGEEFLKYYFKERREACKKGKCLNKQSIEAFLIEQEVLGDTQKKLGQIARAALGGEYLREELDRFLKAFEVRKRLHDSYVAETIKPVDMNKYYNYNNYLLLACCCILFYENSTCLKYLNTLLKVGDTLLSIRQSLSEEQDILLGGIILTEVAFIKKIAKDKGICINWEEHYV